MIEYLKIWAELKGDRRAVTALEYGVIAAAVIVVGLTAFSTIGGHLQSIFSNVDTAITPAAAPAPG